MPAPISGESPTRPDPLVDHPPGARRRRRPARRVPRHGAHGAPGPAGRPGARAHRLERRPRRRRHQRLLGHLDEAAGEGEAPSPVGGVEHVPPVLQRRPGDRDRRREARQRAHRARPQPRPLHDRRVQLHVPVLPEARARPGVEEGIVLHRPDRPLHGVDRPPAPAQPLRRRPRGAPATFGVERPALLRHGTRAAVDPAHKSPGIRRLVRRWGGSSIGRTVAQGGPSAMPVDVPTLAEYPPPRRPARSPRERPSRPRAHRLRLEQETLVAVPRRAGSRVACDRLPPDDPRRRVPVLREPEGVGHQRALEARARHRAAVAPYPERRHSRPRDVVKSSHKHVWWKCPRPLITSGGWPSTTGPSPGTGARSAPARGRASGATSRSSRRT